MLSPGGEVPWLGRRLERVTVYDQLTQNSSHFTPRELAALFSQKFI